MIVYAALIRNGETQGEKDGKHLGPLDEDLSPGGKKELEKRARERIYPDVELVYTGETRRCFQTVETIYPLTPAVLLKELAPFDMGGYNSRTYHSIRVDEQFNRWAEQSDLEPLGGGESPHKFHARCRTAYLQIVEEMLSKGLEIVAVVTHRLVMESILQRFLSPAYKYKNWNIQNGGGYLLSYNTGEKTAKIEKDFEK